MVQSTAYYSGTCPSVLVNELDKQIGKILILSINIKINFKLTHVVVVLPHSVLLQDSEMREVWYEW
jgi:hypothetical protein